MKVVLLRGLPGSGKDVFANTLAHESNERTTIISANNYFVLDGQYQLNPAELAPAHEWCHKEFLYACASTEGLVIVSNTNMQLFELAPYIMFAKANEFLLEIYEVETPGATFGDYVKFNNHGVDLQTIASMAGSYEPIPSFWPKPIIVNSLRDEKSFLIDVDVDGNFKQKIAARI